MSSQPNFSFGAPRPQPARSGPRSFPARYRSLCNGCDEWIDEGDLIVMTDDGAVHEECQGIAPQPVRKATATEPGVSRACPTCFLVHPKGSCDRE